MKSLGIAELTQWRTSNYSARLIPGIPPAQVANANSVYMKTWHSRARQLSLEETTVSGRDERDAHKSRGWSRSIGPVMRHSGVVRRAWMETFLDGAPKVTSDDGRRGNASPWCMIPLIDYYIFFTIALYYLYHSIFFLRFLIFFSIHVIIHSFIY